jgi:branched-chain amino acid transport system permease protein
MGVHPGRYKTQAFILSAMTAGMAGSLFAHVTGYLNPNSFTFQDSVTMLLMVVVGGQGSVWGAAVGAVLLTLAPEYMRFLKDYRLVVYGAMVVGLMVFLPDGLAGVGRWVVRRLPARAAAAVARR